MAGPGKIMKIGHRRVPFKALILLAVAGILIGLAEFSPLKAYLRPDRFQSVISEAGLVGPALLLLFCAIGTCFFIPGTVFVGIGAAIFGPYLGFACVWPGTLAGAVISWLAARRLGREFVCSLIGNRLMKYDNLIERNGFKTVLLLRLMFVPLVLINYGAGLTKVRFWDYFFATALGEAATIFAVTFFIGEIREIWISGDPRRLFSPGMVLSFGILISLAFVAKLIRRRYQKCN
jgi:uncharacterized membrane protein YdjX (TVP38/TMEM64 family)